jgi:hypothetical protein
MVIELSDLLAGTTDTAEHGYDTELSNGIVVEWRYTSPPELEEHSCVSCGRTVESDPEDDGESLLTNIYHACEGKTGNVLDVHLCNHCLGRLVAEG